MSLTIVVALANTIKDMGALSSFTFGDKQRWFWALTMSTVMTDANFSRKLQPYEAQLVAAFLPVHNLTLLSLFTSSQKLVTQSKEVF